MKPLLASLAIVLLGFGTAACGGTSRAADSASTNAPNATGRNSQSRHAPATDAGIVYDGDDAPIRFYGHEADTADRQAITALVTHYYAVAAKGDGANACALIHSLIAEAIPEEYGEQPALRGKTCAVVMSKLFKQRHHHLSIESATPEENASLKIIGVRIEGDTALVLLRFAKRSQPNHIAVHREGHAWKIWELFGTHMP